MTISAVLPAASFKADQIRLDPDKPTILICSDSPGIHTGQAQIVRNIWRRIHALNKYNLVQLAWWHLDPKESVPWTLLDCNKRPDGLIDAADRYGDLSLNNVVDQLKVDIVWGLGDPWMLRPLVSRRTRLMCPMMAYIPVDGGPLYTIPEYTPLSPGWAEVMNTFDTVVPLVPSAERMFKEAFPDASIHTPIPCGVDRSVYFPKPEAERIKIKTTVFSLQATDKLVISVGRNQQRKHTAINVAAMHFLTTGHYSVCRACGEYTIWNRDWEAAKDTSPATFCKHCGSKYLEDGTPAEDLYYYMHLPLDELAEDSYRITVLLRQFGLLGPNVGDPSNRVLTNKTIRSTHGMPESTMASYYNAADLLVQPAFGEGWGLPISESIACGTPVIVPNCSAPPDFIGQAGRTIKIGYRWCEPQTTYWRGMVDLDAWVGAIHKAVYTDPIPRENCEAVAANYDWDKIVPMWVDLIDGSLAQGESRKVWHQAIKGV